MKRACLLPLLFLPALAPAAGSSMFTLETYSVPAATWLKIPTTMRDDHALLRTTLIGQLPKGKITLRDRIGGSSRGGQRVVFKSLEEILTPLKFGLSNTAIYPLEWGKKEVGSSLELDANRGRSMSIDYILIDPDPALKPLVGEGNRLDQARSALPMFPIVRLSNTVPFAKVTLAAISPDPNRQQREKRLFVSFLVTDNIPEVEAGTKREGGHMVELLGLQGSTRSATIPPAQLMKELLRRSDAHAFSIGGMQASGRRTTLEAIQEIPHPVRAQQGTSGPVPSTLATVDVGTSLSAQVSSSSEGKVSVVIQVDHDLRDPILPSIPGKGEALVDNTRIPFTMQLRARKVVGVGSWVLLTEQPLSEVFDATDRKAKGESLYLFCRILPGKK